MKKKKIVTLKPVIAGAFAVACVIILVVCLKLQGNDETKFVPEPTAASAPVESWAENSSTAEPENGIVKSDGTSTSIGGEYPKVVESDGSQTVVDFTDPTPTKPKAPATPEGKTEVDPSSSHPVQKDPTVKAPKQESGKSITPAPGSKNEKGEIYDPVFGWIKPADWNGEPIDNDGDPNKQVGSMGGN